MRSHKQLVTSVMRLACRRPGLLSPSATSIKHGAVPPQIAITLTSASSAMSKKDDQRKNVLVVGGGLVGTMVARQLSAKLDASQFNLILVSDRPYAINLVAAARMIVTDVDQLDQLALVPYDKLFINGNGTFHQGRVTAIEETAPGEGGNVVLEDGERISYAALILVTGSKWPGAINFPEASAIHAHINKWRARIEKAQNICVVGGGAVGIGTVHA